MKKSTENNKYLRPLAGVTAGGLLGAGVGSTIGHAASVPFYTLGRDIGEKATKRLVSSGLKRGIVGGSLVGLGAGLMANKYLQKIAESNAISDESKNALKTFAKLTAVGLAGTVGGGALGAKLGSKLAKTEMGIATRKRANYILRKSNSKLKTGMSVPTGAVTGAFVGAHAAGGAGDLITLHHDYKAMSKK